MATFVTDPLLMRKRILQSINGYFQSFASGSFMAASRTSVPMKPPNILVYYPNAARPCPKDCVTTAIEQCLPDNRYVVYALSKDIAIKDPWMENCQLVFVPALSEHKTGFNLCDAKVLENYLSQQGKIINFCQNVMEYFGWTTSRIDGLVNECKSVRTKSTATIQCELGGGGMLQINQNSKQSSNSILLVDTSDGHSKPVAIKCTTKDGGQIVHCSLPLLKLCLPNQCQEMIHSSSRSLIQELLQDLEFNMPTTAVSAVAKKKAPCYLLSMSARHTQEFLSSASISSFEVCDVKGISTTLQFMKQRDFSQTCSLLTSELDTIVPVLYSLRDDLQLPSMKFNWEEYWRNLRSEKLGRVVLYSDLVTSTMDIVEPLVERMCRLGNFNVTCIAHQQTNGKGRGGNKWLSPAGTAMFTLAFSIPLHSPLGKHLSLVQHIMTVAVVHAVRSMPGLQKLDVRVKWPNDIYIGSSVKIGGVLVKSTIFRSHCIVTIGCGVNVSNEFPTKCINDAIKDGNFQSGPVSCEQILANSISCLEELIKNYQSRGPNEFFDLYYKYWIHSDQKVQVRFQNRKSSLDKLVDAKVVGIDDSGFLRVTLFEHSDGAPEEVSLQPDSNSFDMTKNLIAMKSLR